MFLANRTNVFKLGKTNNLTRCMNDINRFYIKDSTYMIKSGLCTDMNLAEFLLFDKLKEYRIDANLDFLNAN